jgi:RNA polymerase sigma factor (sigma-70 family)
MNRGREGEEVGRLVEEFQPRLRAFIRKRVARREDAEDILQDVFFQLAKAVGSAMHPIEEVSAWLYRVARNRIINWGTKKREEEWPAYLWEDGEVGIRADLPEFLYEGGRLSSPESELMRSLVWSELESALSELPPEQREVFELTVLDGLPVKEIAEATGVAVGTLLSRKYYAVRHLRRRLEWLYEEWMGD